MYLSSPRDVFVGNYPLEQGKHKESPADFASHPRAPDQVSSGPQLEPQTFGKPCVAVLSPEFSQELYDPRKKVTWVKYVINWVQEGGLCPN